MNEQNKKLLECAEFIKESCENRDFCDGCVFHKEEIKRVEYTNEPINYNRYCEHKYGINTPCYDCPAKIKGNREK